MDLCSNMTKVLNDNFPLRTKLRVVLNHLCSKFSFFFEVKKERSLFILLPSPPAYPLNSHKSCFIPILALWLCWHLPHYCNVLVICKNYKRQIDWFPTFQITFCPPLLKLAVKICMMKRHFVWSDVCLYKWDEAAECSTVCYITVTEMIKLVSAEVQ